MHKRRASAAVRAAVRACCRLPYVPSLYVRTAVVQCQRRVAWGQADWLPTGYRQATNRQPTGRVRGADRCALGLGWRLPTERTSATAI